MKLRYLLWLLLIPVAFGQYVSAGYNKGSVGAGISVVQGCGKNTSTSTASPSWSASCSQNLASGNTLIVVAAAGSGGTTTISDSLGNVTAAACTFNNGLTLNIYYCSFSITTGGSDTITLNGSFSTFWMTFSLECHNCAGFDAAGTAVNNGASTTWTLPGVTTTHASDLVIGFGGNGSANDTFTAGSGYTIPSGSCGANTAGACGQASGGAQCGFVEYQVVTTATTYTPAATVSGSISGSSQTISFHP